MFTRLFLALGIAAVLSACGKASTHSYSHSHSDKKRILTTFTIIQDIAQNVAGDAAVVESITKPGAEIHDYEPTPHDLVKAQDADLVKFSTADATSAVAVEPVTE